MRERVTGRYNCPLLNVVVDLGIGVIPGADCVTQGNASNGLWLNISLFGILIGNQVAALGQSTRENRLAASPAFEEKYIARSVRESRTAPTEFCAQARTGFADAAFEGRYSFRSTATRSSDGRVVDANVKAIGSGHACFGRTSDPAILSFYAEIVLTGAPFKGTGECRSKADSPEGSSIATIRLWIRH